MKLDHWSDELFRHNRSSPRLCWLIGLACIFGSNNSVAIEFEVAELRDGLKVVYASGPIVSGDTARLRSALSRALRDPTGAKVLFLNSPGGDVQEAFAMAKLMNEIVTNTIVPPGASCASACAAIVFISGQYHWVMEGGKLGMHHCYSGTGKLQPHCNEKIAEHAVTQAVAYGSVMAFMKYTMPNEMTWLSSSEADCFGLTRWPGEATAASRAAPCVVAVIRGEKLPISTRREK